MTECHLATCLHNHIVTDIIVHSQRHTGTEFVLVSLIYILPCIVQDDILVEIKLMKR